MNADTANHYSSYQFTVGDADFVFFTLPQVLADKQSLGTTMHSHTFYEFFYVLRGNITISTEIGEVSLTEKDAAIVSPGVTHTTAIPPGSMRICLPFAIAKNKNIANSNYFDAFEHILNHQIVRADSFVGANAFKRFIRYFQSDYPEKKELVTACLYEIMVLLKASLQKKSDSSSLLSDTNNLRTYIIDDFFTHKFQNGSLEKLAESLHLSTQQTQRIIKKMYHRSFSECMTAAKMNYAKTLLLESDLSVTQIAAECGYSGTNGFFVAFKNFFDTTPHEFRKEAGK